MALHHLLYRCPECGHDPLGGEGDRAQCTACSRVYERRRQGGTIHVTPPGGDEREVPIGELVQKIEERGGPVPAASGPDGRIAYATRATAREADLESPVRFRGKVLGFVEQLGEGAVGQLSIDEEALRFAPDAANADPKAWPLLGIRAVQSSSSSIQISPLEGGVILFRFESDSPVRWESLVKHTLQRAYDREGRGKIREFQPRIVIG